jgi:outer membrane lipoprotein carrier protein
MEKADAGITTLSFSFTQEITYTLTSESQTVIGDIIFTKPDSIYFKQQKPLDQVIIANKKKVWIYTPSYNQVVTDTWKKWVNNGVIPNSITTFSSGWGDMEKNYVFGFESEDDQFYILNLKPKKKDHFDWSIEMWVDKKDYCPRKILLYGENVRIKTQCDNYKINPVINKALFDFVPPKGTDVIEMP